MSQPVEVLLPLQRSCELQQSPAHHEGAQGPQVEAGAQPDLARNSSARNCRGDLGRTSIDWPDAKAARTHPVDRGPAAATAGAAAAAATAAGPARAPSDASRALLSSWQYRVTGKAAVAEVLQYRVTGKAAVAEVLQYRVTGKAAVAEVLQYRVTGKAAVAEVLQYRVTGKAAVAEVLQYRVTGKAAVAEVLQYRVTGKAAVAEVLQEVGALHIRGGGPRGTRAVAVQHILRHDVDSESIYVVDLAAPYRLFKAWRAAMPRVLPYYAVKCYPEPAILKLLIALGAGFDCASKGELDMMLRMGVSQSRIIFAHPCKRGADFRYAREYGIQHTTFDTSSELHKVAEMDPEFKLVLRIRADDPGARVPLGLKYGAEVEEAPGLLREAKELGLEVVGVSFHVGSAAKNLATFTNAIENARKVFDEASALGFKMDLLDIGGGFTGHFDGLGNVMFGEIATTINAALAAHFPPGGEGGEVRVIAEPGRYFAEASSTLFTPVIGQRDRIIKDGSIHKDYWLTDGLYGSFNCIVYDGQNPEYRILRSPQLPPPETSDPETYLSTLWGPTCDSADVVYKDVALPPLRNGDWLQWPNAGAYTVAGACDFNGIEFTHPRKVYVWSDSVVDGPDASAPGDGAEEGEEAEGAAEGVTTEEEEE
ncbi:hypothetical protein HYH03_011224 [Edaphochlamys debaryana]|uniref:ornithine decarboxylase n=1 Tax=Edaphochlamys debaryana TaxID=47281 RepID=A0A836BWM4_9CHLO|nr:hypothetical protein HYH03_011224 [Edaphochlamys debaryana]|eukprot:KAG2490269.1 hypothetical protein HYH03_011224 [Edaphochlamys debaryana]